MRSVAATVLAVVVGSTDLSAQVPTPTTTRRPPVSTETPEPTLSEVERLQVENHRLRVQVANLQKQLFEVTLSQERATLDGVLARPGYRFNWSTGSFEKEPPK